MITAFCFTNLDSHQHERWPEEFEVKPVIGERVESFSGKTLKIVAITHMYNGHLKVELHN